MNTKQMGIIAVTLVAFLGMLTYLIAIDKPVDTLVAVVTASILPTVTGFFAVKRAGEAREGIQQVQVQTNGNQTRMLDLINKAFENGLLPENETLLPGSNDNDGNTGGH